MGSGINFTITCGKPILSGVGVSVGWMAMYEDELYANWETYQECGEYFKIDPLR